MRKEIMGLTALLCCGLLGGTVVQAAEAAGKHRVKKGETLWEISGTHLQDPHAWPKVWKANPAIKNPHRIAPGQVVTLPGKAKAKTKTVAAVAPAPPPPAMPAIERTGPPLALTVVREESVKAKSADEITTVHHRRGIGQVTGELPEAGKVLVTQTGWSGGTTASTIFVQAVDAKPGAIYGVYRDLGKVKHPSFFKGSPGRLLAEIGVIEIVALEGERQLARVTKSYDVVQQGDLLGPLPEPLPLLTLRNHSAAVATTVVAVEFNRLIAAPKDVVYLDAGAEQGLVPGDRLRVSGVENGNGRRQSAFVAVLAVTPTTAAALVLPESDHQVSIGDRVGPAL